MTSKIIDLKEIPEAIPTLASWHHEQWAYLNPGSTLKKRIAKMQTYLNEDFIPSTWVAMDEQIMGSAAIVHHDLDIRRELSPWLASVFVAPEFRRRGIASQLVRHVCEQTRKQGITKFYLYTPDQAHLYSTLGWQIRETTNYLNEEITIMEIDLNQD